MGEMRIILASASPRRKELLRQIGWEFEIMVSEVEETVTKSTPQDIVEELSQRKAEAVLCRIPREATDVLVIGADTIVVYEGQILGKPSDEEDAKRMLRLLQGKSHFVYTGVTLCCRRAGEEQSITFHEATKVNFYPMTEQEIQEYAACGEPADKAGAYGIQGICARYISGIEGDYNNVVGLPVGRLYRVGKELIR